MVAASETTDLQSLLEQIETSTREHDRVELGTLLAGLTGRCSCWWA